MLDFNNKKNILRSLRRKGEENLFWRILCSIAAVFVRLWYDAACAVSMIFSDRQGNLLGIKGLGRGERAERRVAEKAVSKKTRRQDDIVYVRKPFFGRLLSAVLAFSFVFMFVPELGIDLGLSLVASALEPFTFEGERYYANPNNTPDFILYFKQDDYNHARDSSVSGVNAIKRAYGSMMVTWHYNADNGNVVSGFQVKIIDTSKNNAVVYNEYLEGGPDENGDISYIFEDLTTTGTLRIEVTPITYIDQWRFIPEYDIEVDGQITKIPASLTVYSDGKQNLMYQVQGKEDKHTLTGLLNARFPVPDLKFSSNGNSDECYDESITITWNDVQQSGGTEDKIEYPYAYILYRSEDGGPFRQQGNLILYDAENAPSYTDKTIVPGRHYQYFVEAFRYAWNEEEVFNPHHNGIISSSAGIVKSSADDKAVSSTYSSKIRDLYVAPAKPSMNVQPGSDNNSYFISITNSPGGAKTNYSGVYLFRSTGAVPVSASDIKELENDPDGVYNGNFGKWLVTNCMSGNETYKIDYITTLSVSGNNTTLTHLDRKNIVAGVSYWYYAVAFLDKGNDVLYGKLVERQTTTLELALGTPMWVKTEPGDGKVDLEWEEVPGADGYEIEIIKKDSFTNHDKDDKNDEDVPQNIYVEPEALDVGKRLKYTHERLYNDDVYAYRVRAYIDVKAVNDKSEEKPKYYGGWSTQNTVTVGTVFGIPQNVTATTVDGKVTVTWEPVDGAKGYILYYKLIGEDDQINVKDEYFTDFTEFFDGLTGTTYTHTNLHNGDRYMYYIKAYKNIPGNGKYNTQRVMSERSNSVAIKVGQGLNTPQNVKTSTKDGEITIEWEPVAGAEGYILYISGPNGVEERDITKPPYVHVGLKNGDRYTYYIRAYKTVNGQRDWSPESVHLTQVVGDGLGIPQDFKATSTEGQITLSWAAVTGAEGYVLEYRRPHESWDVYGINGRTVDISRTTFDHTRLNNGDVYEYRIRAYKTVNGDRVYSEYSVILSMTVGTVLDSPKDFTVTTADGNASLKWTAVTGAEGYIVYAYSAGRAYQFDVSKPGYEHTNLANGDSWTYYVVAYKTVNGEKTYSSPTKSITVKIGVSLNAALDLTATAGNHQIDLSWKAVTGAEGYVVYLYNSKTMEFEPIAEVSGTTYSHIGLKNGTKYTYMVAPFKTTNGTRFYGEYSITVSATPTTGSPTDVDRELNVKGTAPYGISHGEYISADANHEAFDEAVDVYFTTNKESTNAVKNVLKNYANGLSSFVIYPFDISIYQEGTKIKVDPADGFTVTITMPIPDILIAYRDYLTVVHINEHDYSIEEDEIEGESLYEDWYNDFGDQRLEVLPCAIVDIDNVWCVQFKCASFSPYAIVIYKEHISDVSAGFGIFDGDFAGTFNTGGLLLFTALPDIMPHNKKLRVVRGGSKRYRIKNVEKK
ncbi:MAG: fibronectin type III domain-containing protein [Oscillospiraceae bacterium]|nr:fibronectin type III domain-containing protein [Oscillospiraceae bacterium]